MKQPTCSYYGRLQGKLLGPGIGTYLVDEAYKRLLEKHTKLLSNDQERLVKSLKEYVSKELSSFARQLKGLTERLNELKKDAERIAK